jgi:hypothetical protein
VRKRSTSKANFYEIFFVAVWTADSSISDKIKFLFMIISRGEFVTFEQFYFVFLNSARGFLRIHKGKRRISQKMLELAARKAFRSADIRERNELSIDEVRLWIKFNSEFEVFLESFTNDFTQRTDQKVFKPFLYKIEIDYFDRHVLNTQKVKVNISRSLSLNFKKENDQELLWKYAKIVKPSDKFEIRKANALLKKNIMKFDYSSHSTSEASIESLQNDPLIKKFLIIG